MTAYVSIGFSESVSTTSSRSLLAPKTHTQGINNSNSSKQISNDNDDDSNYNYEDKKNNDNNKNDENLNLIKEKISDVSLLNIENNEKNKASNKKSVSGLFEEISTIKINNITELNKNENLKNEKHEYSYQILNNLGENTKNQKNSINLIPFLRNDFGLFSAQHLPPPLLLDKILVRVIIFINSYSFLKFLNKFVCVHKSFFF